MCLTNYARCGWSRTLRTEDEEEEEEEEEDGDGVRALRRWVRVAAWSRTTQPRSVPDEDGYALRAGTGTLRTEDEDEARNGVRASVPVGAERTPPKI